MLRVLKIIIIRNLHKVQYESLVPTFAGAGAGTGAGAEAGVGPTVGPPMIFFSLLNMAPCQAVSEKISVVFILLVWPWLRSCLMQLALLDPNTHLKQTSEVSSGCSSSERAQKHTYNNRSDIYIYIFIVAQLLYHFIKRVSTHKQKKSKCLFLFSINKDYRNISSLIHMFV